MLGIFEVVLNVVTMLVDTVHTIAVNFDLELLLLELLLFAGLLADDDCHFNRTHPVDNSSQSFLFVVVAGPSDLSDKLLYLFVPESGHVVVHLDRSEFVERHDDAFSQITSTRKVIDNVLRYPISPAAHHRDFRLPISRRTRRSSPRSESGPAAPACCRTKALWRRRPSTVESCTQRHNLQTTYSSFALCRAKVFQ